MTFNGKQRNFPSSFHGAHGSIIYSMKVEIHRPWHLTKAFETEFNFATYIDTNQPHLLISRWDSYSDYIPDLMKGE
ncbi:arrestin domain-containing protein 3-like isoform X2 [Salvelinus namaycush]|uniref:Arrestin domain-containing protein 3-like isoform X2 n=1 Tax=Salvelinus namaycush TaxID=8040 RepID=A0A8U0Q6B8_SALNM|nr:arrestin domain-containing protein 3-like isoform X2 [Salvelinus namaycush]